MVQFSYDCMSYRFLAVTTFNLIFKCPNIYLLIYFKENTATTIAIVYLFKIF